MLPPIPCNSFSLSCIVYLPLCLCQIPSPYSCGFVLPRPHYFHFQLSEQMGDRATGVPAPAATSPPSSNSFASSAVITIRYTVQYYTILYYTILYYTILYAIIILLFHTQLACSKFSMVGYDIDIANNQILYGEKEQDIYFWNLS